MQDPLKDVRANVIRAWEIMALAKGTNPLVGRILGVLYTSSEPLSQKDISGKVGYELSAVSQALSLLSSLGAIRRIKKPSVRMGYYESNAPVSAMLSSTLARWLDAEKAFHAAIKQQIRRLKEIQAKTSYKEEARSLLVALREMDLALQRMVEILDEAVTKIQKGG